MKRYTLYLHNETRKIYDIFTGEYLDEKRAYNALISKVRCYGEILKGDTFNAIIIERDADYNGSRFDMPVKYVRKIY